MLVNKYFFLYFLFIIISNIDAIKINNSGNQLNFNKLNNGLNITYDHRSLIINGERKLLVSGSVHYPRASVSKWNEILKSSKLAGVDIIETYIFWNVHQPNTPNEFYLEDNANITLFLDLCKENELFVNLRIGPYVCAEWNYGGFPIWLKNIEGIVFRDYNQPFMDAMSTWVTMVVDKLQDYFAPNGGPIIIAQIENEYGWLENEYGASGREYALWAINFAKSLNIGIPWIMCAQEDIDSAINTCNGFYCHDWIDRHWNAFPDQPAFWTENWVGWFENWGQAVPKRPVQDMLFSSARFIAYGGSLFNYYMWFGGTNFGRSVGGPWIITSYEYDAPLDEFGFPNEPKYSMSTQFHFVIHKYESIIMGMDPPTPVPLSNISEAHPYGEDLVFLTNFGLVIDYIQWQGTNYTLQPWSVVIVYSGSVVFDTSYVPDEYIKPSTRDQFKDVPNAINYDSILSFSEWGQSDIINDCIINNESPLEQINLTNDTTDYLWYTTNITLNETTTLTIENMYDFCHVFLNGAYQGNGWSPVAYITLEPTNGNINYQLQILTMTMGLENYAAHMESYSRGLLGSISLGQTNITNNQWSMKPGILGEKLQIYNEYSSSKVNWQPYNPSATQSMTWYQFNISLDGLSSDPSSNAYVLNMTSMNKGFVYVNGFNIGRYFLMEATQSNCTLKQDYIGIYTPSNNRIDCNEPSQSLYHIPLDWLFLQQDKQYATVILFEEVNGDPTKIQLLSL
ncbi:hypothetical protein DICPUDRAFT_48969 [Dictyostelium purpureum]|uniref:Beta-galactosidase n=1 Tax=Dictyostelium purpureum TaxID=5786 RepID=F0ZRS6_DICPU|nr:uncharacterized protein DICPUDRAFT_48969 [Dictyostelium purpureum]EGC33370.1 hypothetical protein DICPUDRAFT_48969 [Dictyostelium purpureum]|eukprot:XP_003290121.1 hypothetical protein DICPUDRAFT_48969 [Dictyostelium purpureum]